MVHRAVAPHRRLPDTRARRQDLLLELAHRDLVIVDTSRAPLRPVARARHRRRDHQRRDELVDRTSVEHATRRGLRPGPPTAEAQQQQPRARTRPILHEAAPGDRQSVRAYCDGSLALGIVHRQLLLLMLGFANQTAEGVETERDALRRSRP
jgi:hypothetical protein